MARSRCVPLCGFRLHAPDTKQRPPPPSTLNTTFFVGFREIFLKLAESLPKQVPPRLHKQVASGSGSLSVRVVSHHGDGDAGGLTHDEFGGRGELVGYRQDAGGERITVAVLLSPVVCQGVHAGHADSDVDYAVPPRSPEGVGDHDGHLDAEPEHQALTQAVGGGIRVHGEEADRFVAGDVRDVDASVRADEAVVGLRDDYAAVHPHDALALAEDDLDLAGVLVVVVGEAFGESGRLDRSEVHEPPFGLANDLVRYDHDVARLEQIIPRRPDNKVRQVVAWADLGDAAHGQYPQLLRGLVDLRAGPHLVPRASTWGRTAEAAQVVGSVEVEGELRPATRPGLELPFPGRVQVGVEAARPEKER